ncbi:MAG: hypothetical protein NPIRA05_19600 [Nitrospirales bacterium]|nr:MAG: hypothetical protein NPIRA05_19600 [Nitrospirales bacterium]
MKYQPSLPERNDNISHQHPVREFIILILGVIGLVVLSFWILGLLVDQAVDSLPPEDEAKLFAKIDLSRAFGTEGSQKELNLLQRLIDSLDHCHNIPFPLTVHLIDSMDINAIALPGGDIVVYSGLLNHIPTTNGLAFVLAHELGHFKNRDHLRSIGRGLVLAALVTYFTGSNSDMSQMIASSLSLGQAKYSQSRESQADETALEILNCHYGHVGGATELFEALQQDDGSWGIGMLHYFDTHPELQKRIDALHDLGKARGYQIGETVPLKGNSLL